MSQIETIMLVALGFAIAALLALFLMRAVWVSGVSLGRRRTERQAPIASAELQADRHRVRAEFAMMTRKLEVRIEDLNIQLGESRAESGRSRNRIEVLGKDVARRDHTIAEREQEIARLKTTAVPLEAELAGRTDALQRLKDALREQTDRVAALVRDLDQAKAGVKERDGELRLLKGQLGAAGLLPEHGTEPASAHARLQQRLAELGDLARDIEAQRRQITRQKDEIERLRRQVAESGRRSGEAAADDPAFPRPGPPEADRAIGADPGAGPRIPGRGMAADARAAVAGALARQTGPGPEDKRGVDAAWHARSAEPAASAAGGKAARLTLVASREEGVEGRIDPVFSLLPQPPAAPASAAPAAPLAGSAPSPFDAPAARMAEPGATPVAETKPAPGERAPAASRRPTLAQRMVRRLQQRRLNEANPLAVNADPRAGEPRLPGPAAAAEPAAAGEGNPKLLSIAQLRALQKDAEA